MSHILFATIGSLGDLHPFIAIALKLRERNHRVAFCTSEHYRARLETLGFPFHPLRPDVAPNTPEMLQWSKDIMDARKGAERLHRDFLFPRIREMYDDLSRAVASAKPDLLVSSEIAYAAPVVAEKLRLSWASCVPSPICFFSLYDPPILPPIPRLSRFLFSFGPRLNRVLVNLMKSKTRPWTAPMRKLRADLGLAAGRDPIYEGKHSPSLVLALYSSVLGAPQPDWPPNTIVTGFPFYDGPNEPDATALEAFLQKGPPPIVFTLGSAAVFDPRQFYHESIRAAELLGQRAVLLIGSNPPPPNLPPTIAAFDYLPFSRIFPRASVIVHQGGIGTTGQALRAARPMLIMPCSHDQPDNAHRIAKLKAGRTISRDRYTAQRAAAELQPLLRDPIYARTAEAIARQIQNEDGASTSADALEALLR